MVVTRSRPPHCPTCSCPPDLDDAAPFIPPITSFPIPHTLPVNNIINNNHPKDEDRLPTPVLPPQHHPPNVEIVAISAPPTTALPLPPPLPEPKVSVRRRILPPHLIALSSPRGRTWLMEALTQQTSAPYLLLTEQFVNQSDPAFCGISTLLMVLNALAMDPTVRWKGGWRYYGSEQVLLSPQCCWSVDHVQRLGITLDQFSHMAQCHGLQVQLRRPLPVATRPTAESSPLPPTPPPGTTTVMSSPGFSLQDFRQDLQRLLVEPTAPATTTELASADEDEPTVPGTQGILVVSFSRAALGQTGEGHFSPVAAYHAATDRVLVMDVARFKYPPYWVTVPDLYRALQPVDAVTGLSRGWCLLTGPRPETGEQLRPAHLVPLATQAPPCPIHAIKIQYCQGHPDHHHPTPSHHHHHTASPSSAPPPERHQGPMPIELTDTTP